MKMSLRFASRPSSVVVLNLALAAVACGGSNSASQPKPASPATTSSSEPKDDVVRGITNGQLKIAHYASGDGVTGLVLDRSGDRAKVQFDKQKDIIELTMVEDRHGGERRGWYLKSPDGKNLLYLSTGGSLKTWAGRDEIHLNSDKAATALGQPTIAGQYTAPKSAYDTQLEKITALALQTKTPELASESAGDLAKVKEILASTPTDSFVRLTEAGAKGARYAPASKKIGHSIGGLGGTVTGYPTDDKFDPKGTGLAKFGGKLIPMQVHYGDPNRLHLHILNGWTDTPAKGTPGVVWESKDQLVFVSVDGGRYELSVPNEDVDLFEKGAGKSSDWPAPLQHQLLDVETMRAFAKANIQADAGKEVEAADDAWWSCMNDQWKKTKDALDKNEASSASANDKWGKEAGIRKTAEMDAPKKCEPTKQKLEKLLVANIEKRAAERKAIFDKVKTRF
jgi:hypothetical protein